MKTTWIVIGAVIVASGLGFWWGWLHRTPTTCDAKRDAYTSCVEPPTLESVRQEVVEQRLEIYAFKDRVRVLETVKEREACAAKLTALEATGEWVTRSGPQGVTHGTWWFCDRFGNLSRVSAPTSMDHR